MSGPDASADQRFPLLFSIDKPADLRALAREDLAELTRQLRAFLIESVSSSGGHFAAGLGVVELTVALHYVYSTPQDKIIWDVGHMCYPHKILTGRRDAIHTIRRTGGLASFPDRNESEYDCFGVGHAGTAISAALGMQLGFAAAGQKNHVTAVVGDGGMTAGLSYEALNHAGDCKADLLVILNDNEMSISPNVGALRRHLEMLASTRLYQDIYRSGKRVLKHAPRVSRLAKSLQHAARGAVQQDNIFTALGFQYFGPIDGHDLDAVVGILRNLAGTAGPRLLHLVTTKGKGYRRAEENPVGYHGVSAFDPATGLKPGAPGAPKKTSYSQLFAHWVCAKAERDPHLCAITPAMREGSGLVEFEKRFAKRYFDVGIAEQHALTLAAGLACAGRKPVVAIYSTFLQRAYDQLIHDIWLQQLDVTFAVDRSGIVGGDGATHNGAYDIAFTRCLEGCVLAVPSDGAEAMLLLNAAYNHPGPALVRYPRDTCAAQMPDYTEAAAEIGRARVRRCAPLAAAMLPTSSPDNDEAAASAVVAKVARAQPLQPCVAILVFGVLLSAARRAAVELDATLVDMRFVVPLDTRCLDECLKYHTHIVTIEEGVCAGGAGEMVGAYVCSRGVRAQVLHIGLPAEPVAHGVREELLHQHGLDEEGILTTIRTWLKK